MTIYFPITATVTIQSYTDPGNYLYVADPLNGSIKYGPFDGNNQQSWWQLQRHDHDLTLPDIDIRTYRFSLPKHEQYHLSVTDTGKLSVFEGFTLGSYWMVDPIALRASDASSDGGSDGRGYDGVVGLIKNFWQKRTKYLAVTSKNKLTFSGDSQNAHWIIKSVNGETLKHSLQIIDDGTTPPIREMPTNDPGVFD